MKALAAMVAAFLAWGAMTVLSGCKDEEKLMEGVRKSGYAEPFPLQQGGESIDMLVYVADDQRPYHLYLVFVERRDWPQERKEHLRRLYRGGLLNDVGTTPYPIKLRVRISVPDEDDDPFVDRIVDQREPRFGRSAENGAVTWRTLNIYAIGGQPGVYRVRIDNLEPVPQMDFPTLLFFERDSRTY